MSSAELHQQRGRHYDIIQEALETYEGYMMDDDYDAHGVLNRIIKQMRERLEMSGPLLAQSKCKRTDLAIMLNAWHFWGELSPPLQSDLLDCIEHVYGRGQSHAR